MPYNVYDILDLSKGDILYVKSNIYSGFGCSMGLALRGTGGIEGYNDSSLKTTIIKNLNGMNIDEVDGFKKSIEEEKAFYNSLVIVESKLDFIQKYTGNTSNGFRKFGDTFMDEFKNPYNTKINIEILEKSNKGIKSIIEEIQNESNVIYNLVIDMGKTNNDENVSVIKSNAADTLKKHKN